jgi:hypothetical protein
MGSGRPGVDDLVAALVDQSMRNATKPLDVNLAGYSGRYLEWSVPIDMKSSAPAEFDDCYADPSDGQRNFTGFTGNGIGNRFQQVPGQVDRLWVLDVDGHRLLVDATYSPDTSPTDRQQLQQIVESLRFIVPQQGRQPDGVPTYPERAAPLTPRVACTRGRV